MQGSHKIKKYLLSPNWILRKMNPRKQYICQLMRQFEDGMLPSLAREEPKTMECMTKAHIEAATDGRLPIEFALGRLFDAAWLWGKEAGVDLPAGSDHQKDFEEFCDQLMEPWPLEALVRAGLKIQPIHRSNMKANHRYEISRA